MNATVTEIALQRVLRLKSGDFISAEQIEPEGQYPVYGGNGLRGFTDRWNTEGPIVLIGRQGAQCGNIQIAREKCWVSEHALRCIPEKIYSTNYIRYALEALGLNRYSVSAAQPGLSTDNIKPLRISFPTLETQQRIATFLDEKTSQIDALIEKKRALLERLAEKRQAIITQAVTKGLNPAAPMKDSGIDWLGQIPAHWEVKPIYAFQERITYGFTNPMPTSSNGPYMLTANDIGYGEINFASARMTEQEAFQNDITDKSRPQAGDLLITKDGTLGRVALYDGPLACINQSVALLRLTEGVVAPQFALYCLQSEPYQEEMILNAGGTTIKHIYISRLSKMPLAFPAIDEQLEIIYHCEHASQYFWEANKAVLISIMKLSEYRSALITAAVTGQIESLR